jgi:hypothetical protein
VKPQFRAVFVTTAYNMDWPSKPSLHRSVQRDEIATLVRRAKDLNCNVIILQVRAFGDRIYRDCERTKPYVKDPWAQSIAYGNDPDPRSGPQYDPQGEWINECDAAGIELHAWFNPFRVDHLVYVVPDPAKPKEKQYLPVVKWGKQLYLNPKKKSVQDYVEMVLRDFLCHYGRPSKCMTTAKDLTVMQKRIMTEDGGVSGVLFDHNLPPADGGPRGGTGGTTKRTETTGAEARFDYLKDLYVHNPEGKYPRVPNDSDADVDQFIARLIDIVRNGGLSFGMNAEMGDQRSMTLFKNGKINYVIPANYESPTFEDDLQVWLKVRPPAAADNPVPLVVGGLLTARVQDPGDSLSDDTWQDSEILDRMGVIRNPKQGHIPADGEAHLGFSALRLPDQGGPQGGSNRRNLAVKIKEGHYKDGAPIPKHHGAAGNQPDKPKVNAPSDINGKRWATWDKGGGGPVERWQVNVHDGGTWTTNMLPKQDKKLEITATADAVWVKAINRDNDASDFGKWE